MGSCTNDALVERSAIELLCELEWDTCDAFNEFNEPDDSPLRRENKASASARRRSSTRNARQVP